MNEKINNQLNKPANFMPKFEEPPVLEPFRFWCQKVLPLVYDDSLSYYELLCKFTGVLNDVIKASDSTSKNVQHLYDAYVQLQDWINNYFSNLNIQEEINNKLDQMVLDGTFDTSLKEFFGNTKLFFDPVLPPNGSLIYETIMDSGITEDFTNTEEYLVARNKDINDYYVISCNMERDRYDNMQNALHDTPFSDRFENERYLNEFTLLNRRPRNIVCLQEFSYCENVSLENQVILPNLNYYSFTRQLCNANIYGGMLIATKDRQYNTRILEYRNQGSLVNYAIQKSYILITDLGNNVEVINTHNYWKRHEKETRQLQYKELNSVIKSEVLNNKKLIVCGDFNVYDTDDNESYDIMTNGTPLKRALVNIPTEMGNPADNILYDSTFFDLLEYSANTNPYSDHKIVSAHLKEKAL